MSLDAKDKTPPSLIKTALAFVGAAATIPCIMILWGTLKMFLGLDPYNPSYFVEAGSFFIFSTSIILIFVIWLGVPVYLLMRWQNAVRWWSVLLASTILAAIPYAMMAGPPGQQSVSYVNGRPILVNKAATSADWLNFLQGIFGFSVAGFVIGLVLWLMIRTNKLK
ncbi:MAG: hypothetical protein LBE50_02320 [Gallionellaceae bacterium]|jgi:hypothetical protein|nr:hypothetical protein [Gallionellaceae bacterium]